MPAAGRLVPGDAESSFLPTRMGRHFSLTACAAVCPLRPPRRARVDLCAARDLPAISYWRNNVVALSQHYNLLFVAVRSAIHVYRPAFPNQRIPASGPYIILESEPSTNRPGFIDATHPHGINSLTIGELGHAEVLVSAHDNGDVCVWYTAEIESPRTGHPRIAIRRHVRESAWGVAIHPQRRLLAVSANSAEITVFELGMERDEVRDALSEETADKTSKRKTLRARTRRLKAPPFMGPSGMNEYSLIGHNNNIPNISFLPDSSGRWLVGVGIDGMVLLWDVYATRPVEKCKLGFLQYLIPDPKHLPLPGPLILPQPWLVCSLPQAAVLQAGALFAHSAGLPALQANANTGHCVWRAYNLNRILRESLQPTGSRSKWGCPSV